MYPIYQSLTCRHRACFCSDTSSDFSVCLLVLCDGHRSSIFSRLASKFFRVHFLVITLPQAFVGSALISMMNCYVRGDREPIVAIFDRSCETETESLINSQKSRALYGEAGEKDISTEIWRSCALAQYQKTYIHVRMIHVNWRRMPFR